MRPEIDWSHPITLHAARNQNAIYTVDLEAILETAGVYVFARRVSGKKIRPLYIGQATNLRKRIRQQLNNAKLMIGIRRQTGRRRAHLFIARSTNWASLRSEGDPDNV